jgi:hypothetical protein
MDFKLTANGDLVIGPDGDFEMVEGDEELSQRFIFRLRTVKGDYLLEPDTGCSLEQFKGAPNTDETWAAIEANVSLELSKEGVPFTVDCVPISETEILILIEFDSVEVEDRILQIKSTLDLREGLVYARADSRTN